MLHQWHAMVRNRPRLATRAQHPVYPRRLASTPWSLQSVSGKLQQAYKPTRIISEQESHYRECIDAVAAILEGSMIRWTGAIIFFARTLAPWVCSRVSKPNLPHLKQAEALLCSQLTANGRKGLLIKERSRLGSEFFEKAYKFEPWNTMSVFAKLIHDMPELGRTNPTVQILKSLQSLLRAIIVWWHRWPGRYYL